jgi:ankyrin repeat protein
MFVEYSQQMSACCIHASALTDHLEMETGLSPLHHAARYQRLEICVMLISNLDFVYVRSQMNTCKETEFASLFEIDMVPISEIPMVEHRFILSFAHQRRPLIRKVNCEWTPISAIKYTLKQTTQTYFDCDTFSLSKDARLFPLARRISREDSHQ